MWEGERMGRRGVSEDGGREKGFGGVVGDFLEERRVRDLGFGAIVSGGG